MCPNISLSSKSLLKEEQFIATKVYPLRWLSLWIRRAKTYFLVPVSPVCNTDASVFATFWANETASNIAGDLPIIFLSVIVFGSYIYNKCFGCFLHLFCDKRNNPVIVITFCNQRYRSLSPRHCLQSFHVQLKE